MRRVQWIAAACISIVVLTLFVVGCNSEDQSDDKLPEARPLLEEATGSLQTADSFGIEISVSGYPVEIGVGDFPLPMDLPLLFQYARGYILAPDRLHADVQISMGDFGTTAELIALDQDQYLRSDLLTQNRWLKGEIIGGFSPTSLLAENGGISYALNTITDLEMAGRKDLDGLDVFHLRGTVQARDMYSLTFGLIRTKEGPLTVEVYILVNERLVEQVILHEPLPEGVEDQEPTIWTITLMDYNKPVTITAPSLDENNS